MGYIDRNLLPDEQIILRTKKHLIIFFYPMVWLILSVFSTIYMKNNYILVNVIWAPWVVGGIFWAAVALEYFSSDFAVTNKRIMMREGFFYRHANEMRLSTISQVNVDQSPLGQLLGYGIVTIQAFGAIDSFSVIANPFGFQRAAQLEMDKQAK